MRIYPSIAVKGRNLKRATFFLTREIDAQRDRKRGACELAITAIRCARYIIGSQARFRNVLLGSFLFQILQRRYFSIISEHVRKDHNHFHLPNLEENVP